MTDEPAKPRHPDQAEPVNIEEADRACAPFTVADLMLAFHKPHHRGGTALAGLVPVPGEEGQPPSSGFSAVGDHTDPDESRAVGFAMTVDPIITVTWMGTDTARNLILMIQHAIDSYEAGRMVDDLGRTPVDPDPPVRHFTAGPTPDTTEEDPR